MSIIKSKYLKVEINETGSTLESLYDTAKDRELLWQGAADSWRGKDVTIFPFVARLKDGYYTVDGKRYDMPLHGLCTDRVFEIAQVSEDSVEHKFVYGEDTLKYYPYKFDLRVIHKVDGKKYVKTMKIKNLGDEDMYFFAGGHPAIALISKGDCDTSDNIIKFGRRMSPDMYYLDGAGHFVERRGEYGSFSELACDKALMKKYGTMIFAGEKFDELTLERSDGAKLKFSLGEPTVLAFWSHPDRGEYICVEPWWGLPDETTPKREIKDKTAINKLSAGEEFECTFAIEIE